MPTSTINPSESNHRTSHRIGRRLLNNLPVINPQNFTVNENVLTSTVVGTVVASDPDVGQSLTYSITAGNSLGHFVIGPTNGLLTTAGPLNYETKSSYDLTVQVTDDQAPAPLFNPATNFAVGSSPIFVAIGDVNGDGDLDLAVANASFNNVSLLLGDGTGNFGAAISFTVGTSPRSIAIGDVNNDGDLDLVVSNCFSNNVSVLLGDGTGSFSAATNFAAGSGPKSVAVGDINGDGNLDLAVANFHSDNVSVLLGDGTGNFAAATNFAAGNGSGSVAIGDLNNDGNLDLAVANRSTSSVSVLLGDGIGNFGTAINIGFSGSLPYSVAMGDLNGDGNLDIAVTLSYVGVLLGDGTGSFMGASFGAGGGPLSVAIGDVNRDGKLDLAVANVASDDVSVLLGDGIGGYGPPTNFVAGIDPWGVAMGDVNGDGYLDLAVVNYGSNTVSILLGNETPLNAKATVHIDIGNLIDVPVLQNNNVPIYEGQTLLLSSSNLAAIYADDSNIEANLIFNIANGQQGQFELTSMPGVAQTSFTQQKIRNSEMQFVHDGSLIAPAFTVSVSDGSVSTAPVAGNVTFNTFPRLQENSLTVERGQTVVLTPANFKATDVTNPDSSLNFVISDLQHGLFRTTSLVSQFSQQQVIDGAVQFVHDSSTLAPSFNVSVSDGQLVTTPSAAQVSFSNTNTNTNVLVRAEKNKTVRDAIIGSSVSGGVGLIFLAVKLILGYLASKRIKRALEGKKEGVEKKTFEFHQNVVKPIANKIFKEIKIKGFFGVSAQKVESYIDAVGNIIHELKRIGVDIDLKKMDGEALNHFINTVAEQTKKALVPESSFCSKVTLFGFVAAQTSPEAMKSKAREIARGVRDELNHPTTTASSTSSSSSRSASVRVRPFHSSSSGSDSSASATSYSR